MGAINLRKQYIDKIMENQLSEDDVAMDDDSNLAFLESLSLEELRVLVEES